MKYREPCPKCEGARLKRPDPNCVICRGAGYLIRSTPKSARDMNRINMYLRNWDKFAEANTVVAMWLAYQTYSKHSRFAASIMRYVRTHGDITDKQAAVVRKLMTGNRVTKRRTLKRVIDGSRNMRYS